MKPERRKRYPKDWEQLAWQCKEDAGWLCRHCHIVWQDKELVSKRTGLVYAARLHAAHKNHDPENAHPELLCLCASCHAKYDWQHRRRQREVELERLKHQQLLGTV